jgi:hypothetical protein
MVKVEALHVKHSARSRHVYGTSGGVAMDSSVLATEEGGSERDEVSVALNAPMREGGALKGMRRMSPLGLSVGEVSALLEVAVIMRLQGGVR